MISGITQALPQKQAEKVEDLPLKPQAASHEISAGIGAKAIPRSVTRSPDSFGIHLMKERHGETFTLHYYAALAAAGGLKGREFLQEYRALKREAFRQGMSEQKFRDFEKCLYRRFYRAATQDAVRARQLELPPKVQDHECAYIAKVAGISEDQLKRDALALRQSEQLGRMKSLLAQNGRMPRVPTA